jgi:hypothetical protein
MNRKLIVVLAAVLLLMPVAPLALGSAALTIETGSKYFNPGNTIKMTGTAPNNVTLHLNVTYSSTTIFSTSVVANTSGVYSVSYMLSASAPIGIYSVKATAGNLEASTVFMVTTVSTAEMAQQMISAAEKSQTLAYQTIRAIVDAGYSVPSTVNSTMKLGTEILADASTLYAKANYVAASEAAQRAMALFKNAMTLAIRVGRVEEHDDDLNATLKYQIERLQKESARLQKVVTSLANAGNNVTNIQSKITAASASIAVASGQLKASNYTQAQMSIQDAKGYIQDAMHLLKDLYKGIRRSLMLEYKNHMWERLNAIRGDLGKLNTYITSGNLMAAFKNFGSVESYIRNCEKKMDDGNDDDALSDLESASTEFNNGIGALDSNGYSTGVRNTNAIRAQIQALEQYEASLRRRGKDTNDVENEITRLQALLDEGMGMMQRGKVNDANNVFKARGHGGGHIMGH